MLFAFLPQYLSDWPISALHDELPPVCVCSYCASIMRINLSNRWDALCQRVLASTYYVLLHLLHTLMRPSVCMSYNQQEKHLSASTDLMCCWSFLGQSAVCVCVCLFSTLLPCLILSALLNLLNLSAQCQSPARLARAIFLLLLLSLASISETTHLFKQ